MRSRSVASVMPGVSSQTPTIIMRLTSLSMRSQAVSTRDMRRSAGAVIAVLLAGMFWAWGPRVAG